MNMLEAIDRYKELFHKNRRNRGLSVHEANEEFQVRKYIEEHIIDALNEGYKLVFDPDDFNNASDKPTKEQFKDYLVVQYSGITNMFNTSVVCEYSRNGLTKEIILYIMEHYEELINEYKLSMDDITNDDLEQYGLA